MNLRERLKEAYENISFSADRTWTTSPNAYQKGNMELYLTEHHVQTNQLHRNRPRTVRESIPRSRLAHYANYVYNESREMSYASSTANCEWNLTAQVPTESWEMPEVADLYRWFLKNQPEDKLSRLEGQYQSPLLSVSGFEDKILKIQITEDRVRNLWNKDNRNFGEFQTRSNQIVVNILTSPLHSLFLFTNISEHNLEWFRHISTSRDFDQLEQLAQLMKDQMTSISKFLSGEPEPVSSSSTSVEPSSTEVLYSEVLQGLSPSRKFLTSFKTDHRNSATEDTSSVGEDSFTNYTILSSQKSDDSKDFASNAGALPKLSQFVATVPQASKLLSQKNVPASLYLQSDARYKYQLPVDPNARHRPSMIHPPYIQQTYFYSPVQTVQRWIPSNVPSYYPTPTQFFTSNWFAQNPNPAVSSVNRILQQPPNVENRDEGLSKAVLEGPKAEETQKEEGEDAVEEHQVSTSISEELEIQALEQYSNSNENFYQELERQAAEQYASSPE